MSQVLKDYMYIVYPDVHYMFNFKSPYKKDITSIHSNVKDGVLMYADTANLGVVLTNHKFEKDMENILYYLSKKFSAQKLPQINHKLPTDQVPLYILKIPADFYGGYRMSVYNLFPMPIVDFLDSSVKNTNRTGELHPLFMNEFRMPANFCYGVYHKDLGGLMLNPEWSPFPDFKSGLTFARPGIIRLNKYNEEATATLFDKKLDTKQKIIDYMRQSKGDIFATKNFDNMIDRYHNIYGDDIPTNPEPLDENKIYREFNRRWDITQDLPIINKFQRHPKTDLSAGMKEELEDRML